MNKKIVNNSSTVYVYLGLASGSIGLLSGVWMSELLTWSPLTTGIICAVWFTICGGVSSQATRFRFAKN